MKVYTENKNIVQDKHLYKIAVNLAGRKIIQDDLGDCLLLL